MSIRIDLLQAVDDSLQKIDDIFTFFGRKGFEAAEDVVLGGIVLFRREGYRRIPAVQWKKPGWTLKKGLSGRVRPPE